MFLDKIVLSTQKRVEGKKARLSLECMMQRAMDLQAAQAMQDLQDVQTRVDFPFERALKGKDLSFICEVKKASPSKGLITEEFDYLAIAQQYEEAGAAAVSVLTEPEFFLGKDEYLQEISQSIHIPTLRKDFIVDSYQIYEAKCLGAAAVLLIAEILEESALREYIHIADSLGLSALVESHSLPQLQKALSAGARIIGVNNRNLETFEVDLQTSIRLRSWVPENILFVSESGISTPEDLQRLLENKVNAVLIGETLMKSTDRKAALKQLIKNAK